MRWWAVALSLVVAACSGGGASSSSPADGGSGLPDETSDPDAATDDGGTRADGSSAKSPVFLSMSTDTKTLPEGGSVTFVAVLTDPDGLDDIAGGTLKSPAGDVTYGGFTSGAKKGSFTLALTWNDIHKSQPIEFVNHGTRDFAAEFFDAEGNRATRTLSLTFDCGKQGGSACGGACTDVSSSKTDCGRCGHACSLGRCSQSACLYEALQKTTTDCNSLCKAVATASEPFKCESTCAFTAGTTSVQSLTGASAVSSLYCEAVTSTGSCLSPAPAVAQAGCTTVPPATISANNKTYQFGWQACCCVAR